MAHLQYMPGDPRLVDQLVYELKSKGIFDQFRKDCIADVDTRPAYQNLRQRVENSVATFLSRQCWKPDLNKNQLREKLRKHILDGNYLEQGVERIVDQVVNPKVASVFIPQVEDLVYNYLGIPRKKTATPETSNGKVNSEDLLPEDLEAVSPGSVKSNDEKHDPMDEEVTEESKMEIDEVKEEEKKENEIVSVLEVTEKPKEELPAQMSSTCELTAESVIDIDKISLPTAAVDVKLENIPPPDNSPPKIDLEKIELPKEPYVHPNLSTSDVGPDEIPMPIAQKESFFKPLTLLSEDSSSSDSSLRRNMSPLTPIRNYNNENSCDAQQAFENESDSKSNDKHEPSTFRFTIDAKSPDNNSSEEKTEKKDNEQANLSYQFNNQVNINTFNTPLYDDSSNSNNLHIDYESDANSKINTEKAQETENSEDKKDKKSDERKSSHKSSHRSRDSHRHSSSKDKRSDSKQSSSRDSSRHDKKPKDDHSKSKSSHRESEKSRDRSEKKDRDSSKHRSSSTHKSSSHRDSKSHRSSSSSQKDKKSTDDKKSPSNHKEKSEKSSDKSKDSKSNRDSKSSSHRSDKDRKSSSSSKSKHEDKDKKKDKKDTDDHYSMSGRGNHTRRSTDRDSNDGNSSSSKGSQNHSANKTTENKKGNKESSTKSDNTSTSGDSTSPSDKEVIITNASDGKNQKPIRVENALEVPIVSPPRLPFVPDVTLKKPKFASNLEEAKRMIKMRKFLDEEQKRMNQEAALLLEFQANVRPSLSQVYSSIPGPELEFACITNETKVLENQVFTEPIVAENPQTEITTAINETMEETIEQIEAEVLTGNENIVESNIVSNNSEENCTNNDNKTYNENKPFSELMDEITEYSKASEKRKDSVTEKDSKSDDENKNRTEYFEVTVIAEELSESEDISEDTSNVNDTISDPDISQDDKLPTTNNSKHIKLPKTDKNPVTSEEESLKYFAEQEKYDAEIKRHKYSTFLQKYTEKYEKSDKIYLINCDTYEENIIKEVCANQGDYEVVNYYKNGHLKLPKVAKNVVNNLHSEIILPIESSSYNLNKSPTPVFSPVKSECSFELSSDYDAKLEEMVNKTSRQQVMEIILGSVIDSETPTIDYCMESEIETHFNLKRKAVEDVDAVENNNRQVLSKMRKFSDSDQISSTTEEVEEMSNNNRVSNPSRSKYLGKARRVGLSRPRKTTNLPNSPSSDKSVENYEQNTPTLPTPNGKLKSTPRNKVQRYDTSDLYKPKLHYLSRRNNIS